MLLRSLELPRLVSCRYCVMLWRLFWGRWQQRCCQQRLTRRQLPFRSSKQEPIPCYTLADVLLLTLLLLRWPEGTSAAAGACEGIELPTVSGF